MCKTKRGVAFLGLILTCGSLAWGPRANADGAKCAQYLEDVFSNAASITLLKEQEVELTRFNYLLLSHRLSKEVAAALTSFEHYSRVSSDASHENVLYHIESILFQALQNSVQHGSLAFSMGDYDDAKVKVQLKLFQDPDGVYIVITNPKMFPLPKKMDRQFIAGEFVFVPVGDRPASEPRNYGLHTIFKSIRQLPPGSRVEWKSTPDTVDFILKVQVTSTSVLQAKKPFKLKAKHRRW